MRQLSPLDAQFLMVENPTTVGHVGSLVTMILAAAFIHICVRALQAMPRFLALYTMQPEDLAEFIVSQLKLNRRIFIKEAGMWSTNP